MAKSVSGERFPCDITLRANSSEKRTQKSFGTARVPYLLEFHKKKKENSFIVVRALQTHLEILQSKSSSLRMECMLSAQLKFRFCAHLIVKNPCDLTSQICFRFSQKNSSLVNLITNRNLMLPKTNKQTKQINKQEKLVQYSSSIF